MGFYGKREEEQARHGVADVPRRRARLLEGGKNVVHTDERVTRRSCELRRAEVSTCRSDTDIVADNLQREWERGCIWLGVAVVLTFGPMLALGIYWGWV